jgi:predicted nucleic acid-binding protein
MGIAIYEIYVGVESHVILIEIMAGKRKAKKVNRKLKEKIPASGWLVVEYEHQENGKEEELSQVELA